MAHRAIAVDLGATSGRLAVGEWDGDAIRYEIVFQEPHEAAEHKGRLLWNIELLLGLCAEAVIRAEKLGAETLGIDAWGVDHGFVGRDGALLDAPVCYRDISHLRAFEDLAPHRERIYALTGIQHQPFNTICQLVARKRENPDLPNQIRGWMLLPDLLGYLMGGGSNCELTEASTTQLMGLDGKWSAEVFEIAGWPVPEIGPALPGKLGQRALPWGIGQPVSPFGRLEKSQVRIAHVGSHDTASAVAGFGSLKSDQIFLNIGTWSLAGCLLDAPIATPEAENAGYTNERAVDGRVRFLKNIPGFYFINRLHKDLGVQDPVPDWLARAKPAAACVDILDRAFFNPDSMLGLCRELCPDCPSSEEAWAGFALQSLTAAVCSVVPELEQITRRKFSGFRVGGGGSQSEALCRAIAVRSGLPVLAGPVEATVLGNLGAQFLARGVLSTWDEVYRAIDGSYDTRIYP